MIPGMRTGCAALGATLALVGCSSDDGSSDDGVVRLDDLPDACEVPGKAAVTDALGDGARLSLRKATDTVAQCEWSSQDLLVRVYVDLAGADAKAYLGATAGEEPEELAVEGAAAAWTAHADLEEFQDYYAAAALDGATYAVEVIGPTEVTPRLAAQRILQAGMAALRD